MGVSPIAQNYGSCLALFCCIGAGLSATIFSPPAGGGKGFSLQSLTLAPQDHFPSANLNTKYSILNGI